MYRPILEIFGVGTITQSICKKNIAHALITHLICPFTAPRVLLNDNDTEFRNAVLEEICIQFKHVFTATYHPASNGLVERANRKILEVLRPIVNGLHDNWEDWLPQIAASINGSVNDSTGKSPYFIMFGVQKRFPYDLLNSSSQPVYNIDTYAKQQIQVFSQIHSEVRTSLKATKEEMTSKQHKRAVPVSLNPQTAVRLLGG